MKKLENPSLGQLFLTLAILIQIPASRSLTQVRYDERKENTIQTFPWPTPESDNSAIATRRRILRSEVLIDANTLVRFYEQPTSILEYNSTVSVQRGHRVIAVYPIGRMVGHQPLRLVHMALLRSGDSGSLIAEYEGGGVGAKEGFAVLRFSPSEVKLVTLPLTDYGKVVISRSKPDELEIWSAVQDENVGSPVEDRPYLKRACYWKGGGIVCGRAERMPEVHSPGAVSDPGIEVKP